MEDKQKEMIKGGLSEGMMCDKIAIKHGVPIEDIVKQKDKGVLIEREHSPDYDIQAEISRDHLVEHPYYYDFLEKMEKEMEKDYEAKGYGNSKKEKKGDSTENQEGSEGAEAARRERLKALFG